MDTQVLHKISYGLYIVTVKDENKDNGCIINTTMQISSNPCLIAIALNKNSYTSEILAKTKKLNISIISNNATHDIFENFGYHCGRDYDKFEKFKGTRATNGIFYITKYTNSYISATVENTIDLNSHFLFLAKVEEAIILNDTLSLTYEEYQKDLKNKINTNDKRKGWRCKICGFIYEHEILPPNYICPICKHGAIDFEKIS